MTQQNTFLTLIDFGLEGLCFAKFKSVMGFNDIHTDSMIMPKNQAFRMRAEEYGKDMLGFQNIWRHTTDIAWNRQRTPIARRGIWTNFTSAEKVAAVNVKAVPVDLNYDVYLWSADKEVLNQVTTKYLFWQQNDPNLDLLLDDLYPLELDLSFGEVGDESSVPSMFDVGLFFGIKLPIRIEGWVFVLTESKTIKKIRVRYYDDTVDADGVLLLETNIECLVA